MNKIAKILSLLAVSFCYYMLLDMYTDEFDALPPLLGYNGDHANFVPLFVIGLCILAWLYSALTIWIVKDRVL